MSITISQFYTKLKGFPESFEVVADERDETWLEINDDFQLTAKEELSTVGSLIKELDEQFFGLSLAAKLTMGNIANQTLMSSGGYDIIDVLLVDDKVYVKANEE